MQPQVFASFNRKRLILAGALAVLLIIVWIVSSYSILEIQASQTVSGDIGYSLFNQGSKKSTSFLSKSNKISRVVKKSNYEVSAIQGVNSAIAVIKTRGFFQKTVVNAKLTPQPFRQFVGNAPQSCMYYVGGVLYSYECTGALVKTTHVPATASTPTYNLKTVDGVYGEFESVADTKEGTIALFNTNAGQAIHVLSGQRASDEIVLADLNKQQNYSLAAYKTGFIAYDAYFSSVYYYPSSTSKPEKITMPGPSDATLNPVSFMVANDTIAVNYSDKSGFDSLSRPESIGKVKSEVILYSGKQTKKFSFQKLYANATSCGSDKLCLVDGIANQLLVYSTDAAKPKLLYSVEGVNSIKNQGQSILAFRDSDIVSLNIDQRTGVIAHRLGENKFCGIQNNFDNYLLCITNNKGQSSVLLVTPAKPDTDNIDDKVSKLLNLEEVSAVSAYGKYVFISANTGDLVYDATINGFTYNPTAQKAASEKIDQVITRLGAGSYIFKITNGPK